MATQNLLLTLTPRSNIPVLTQKHMRIHYLIALLLSVGNGAVCVLPDDSPSPSSTLQTTPATNRLSPPEAMKQTLRRSCRKQVPSWLCYWSAYRRSYRYSASSVLEGTYTQRGLNLPKAAGKGVGSEWTVFASEQAS